MADFEVDNATDVITIDGVEYSVTSETDRAKIIMMNKIVEAMNALRRNLNG